MESNPVSELIDNGLQPILDLAKKYNLQEHVAVEVYGLLIGELRKPAPATVEVDNHIYNLKKRELSTFSEAEKTIGLRLGFLRQNLTMPTFMKGIGRNEECPCGSKKKFKKCCLAAFEHDKLLTLRRAKDPEYEKHSYRIDPSTELQHSSDDSGTGGSNTEEESIPVGRCIERSEDLLVLAGDGTHVTS